jgi:hypothetical protein
MENTENTQTQTEQQPVVNTPATEVVNQHTETPDLQQEITQTIVNPEIKTPEVKVTEAKQPVVKQNTPTTNQPKLQPMSFQEWLNSVIRNGTVFEASVASSLVDYQKRMAKGKPVSQQEIESNQKNLFNLYKAIVQNESSTDFSKGINVLLRFANEYKKDCFAETHLFRGFEYIKLGKKDIEAFQFFSTFVSSFAAVETRSLASRQIDVAKLASYFENSNQLVGFINKFKK